MTARAALLSFLHKAGASVYPSRVLPYISIKHLKEHSIQEFADNSVVASAADGLQPVCVVGRILSLEARRLLLQDETSRSWLEVGEALQTAPPSMGPSADYSASQSDHNSASQMRHQPQPPPPTQALQDTPHFFAAAELMPLLEPGDVIQAKVCPKNLQLLDLAVLAPALRQPSARSDCPGGGASLETLHRRSQLISDLRLFFLQQGFLEAETPIMSCYSGLEPHLDPFVAHWKPSPTSSGRPVYLLTSPEYALKRLVVAGVQKVFQLSRVFRNGEVGPFHNPEFTMLEWYRAFSDYRAIMSDLEALILFLAQRLGHGLKLTWQGRSVDLTPPWPRLSVREAFQKYVGFDLADAPDASSLQRLAAERGILLPPDESWEDGYYRLLVEQIEPKLGISQPTYLIDYPAPFAALARVRRESFPVAERFELYLAGVEVGNAYSELNDPTLQAERFVEEQAQRRSAGAPVFEPDIEYLQALERGLPPTGGIAVGIDRLVMLLLDLPDVRRTLAFPFPLSP